jgi:hypothetical protein
MDGNSTSMTEKWQPTKLERRVQEFARSRASKQLLRVPYDDFSAAHRQYVRWEAFALWIRAVVETENCLPSFVSNALKEHCPGLLEKEVQVTVPALLGVRLDGWIQDRVFARAKRERWLDALLFYGVRDPRSQCAFAYWERCEKQWSERRPSRYPTFERWFRSACSSDLFPVTANRIAEAIEAYVDWLSFAYWLEPLFENNLALPERLAKEVESKAPGLLEIVAQLESEKRKASEIESYLMRWIEDRHFSEAKEGNWFDRVRSQIHNHPRYVRISEYSRRWRKERPQDCLRLYPSFPRWSRRADTFLARTAH